MKDINKPLTAKCKGFKHDGCGTMVELNSGNVHVDVYERVIPDDTLGQTFEFSCPKCGKKSLIPFLILIRMSKEFKDAKIKEGWLEYDYKIYPST